MEVWDLNEKPLKGKVVFFDLDDTLTLLEYKYRAASRKCARLLRKEGGSKIDCRLLELLSMEVDLVRVNSVGSRKLFRRDAFPSALVITSRLVLSGKFSGRDIELLGKIPYAERCEFLRKHGYSDRDREAFLGIPENALEREVGQILGTPLERKIYAEASKALSPPWRERKNAFFALETIRERGAKVFIITRGDRKVQESKRSHFPKLAEIFPDGRSFKVIGGEKAAAIRKLLREIGASRKDAFFVGDTYADMRAAGKAGVRGIFVPIRGWKPFVDRIKGKHRGSYLRARGLREVPGKILSGLYSEKFLDNEA
ncbi:MAG: HAD family hydrolase [archaeon]